VFDETQKVHAMNINLGNVTLKQSGEISNEILQIAHSPEIATFLTEKWMYPQPMPESIDFIINHDEEIIGQVSLKSIRWFNRKAVLSLFLKPENQGKKLGLMILEAMMEHAFGKLNFYRLEAEVIEYNERALKLVEMLGFTMEGRLRQAKYSDGKYYDILRFGILKHEFDVSYKDRNQQ
jgi:RimJ/RimL family protein N-acetyltransferase